MTFPSQKKGYPIPALLLVYQDKGVTKHEVEVV